MEPRKSFRGRRAITNRWIAGRDGVKCYPDRLVRGGPQLEERGRLMYIQRRHWLEYDPVALAVLVIGIGIIDARIDHLTPYPGEGHLRARKEPPRPKGSWPRAALPLSTPKTRQSLAQFAPNRCRDQPRKCPVMQSHGITLAFHRKMADSSREFVGPDVIAAVSLESYPRFIKGGFQDYEGLGIKRPIADSKHVPSPRFEVARKQRL